MHNLRKFVSCVAAQPRLTKTGKCAGVQRRLAHQPPRRPLCPHSLEIVTPLCIEMINIALSRADPLRKLAILGTNDDTIPFKLVVNPDIANCAVVKEDCITAHHRQSHPQSLFDDTSAFTPKLVSTKPEWKVYSRCRDEELGRSKSLGYRQKPL